MTSFCRIVAVAVLATPVSLVAAVDSEKLSHAACSFDVIQGSLKLYQAGLQLDSATRSCKSEDRKRRPCAADVTGLINSFVAAGSLLAAAGSNCASSTNQEAACAGAIIGSVAQIAGVANAGASMATSCATIAAAGTEEEAHSYDKSSEEKGEEDALDEEENPLRRLGDGIVESMDAPKSRQHKVNEAWCILDVLSAAGNLGRAGTDITAATQSCDGGTSASCSATVNSVISAFSNVAAYLSLAAAHCAATLHMTMNIKALCAADVAHLVNELSGLASSSSAMSEICKFNDVDTDAVVGGRRLVNVTAAELIAPKLVVV